MFEADRQKYVTKLTIVFWNFANAPKKVNVAKYDKLEEAIEVWTDNFYAKDIRAIGGVTNDRPKMMCK